MDIRKWPRHATLGIGVCFLSFAASAGKSTYIGYDLGDPHWRTSSVAKPLDPDHDNIYGTAGYAVLDANGNNIISPPNGISVARISQSQFSGNSNYIMIDNPQGAGSILTGVWYDNPVTAGSAYNYASITFSASGTYVIGILVDNSDFANISPAQLRIYQPSGTGDSGYINSYLSTARQGDWYFFQVSGNPGDVYYVSGTAEGSQTGSSGIAAITFDAVPTAPAPAPALSPFGLGIAMLGLMATGLFALRGLSAKRA